MSEDCRRWMCAGSRRFGQSAEAGKSSGAQTSGTEVDLGAAESRRRAQRSTSSVRCSDRIRTLWRRFK